MNREILERPFEVALIKSRRGAFGKTLSYVEGSEYIRRLNDALDGQWSFEVVEYQIHETEVVVLGRLTTGNVSKTAFGGSSITTSNQSGELISLADDLKAAATDALKKSASLLGVGLHLYSDATESVHDSRAIGSQPAQTTHRGPGKPNGRSNGTRVHSGNGGNGRQHPGRLTTPQLNAIFSIARSRGISSDNVTQRAIETFGVVPEKLTKPDASAFITELQKIAIQNRGSS